MYGSFLEKEFAHVEFENEQLRRRMATQRLIDAECPTQKHPRRSLADIFGRFVPRIDSRVPARRSIVTPS